MWFWGTHMGGWWWLMVLFYIFFLAGIIILVVVLVKLITGQEKKGPAPSKEDPLEILKRRYAQGEINKRQYEQMKKDIEG